MSEDDKPTGEPFTTSTRFERLESLRRGDGVSWRHSLLFTVSVPLLILLFASIIGVIVWSLLH